MKRLLLLLCFALFTAGSAAAQYRLNYSLSVQSGQPYTPMLSADTLNGTDAYNDIIFGWFMPASLPFDGQSIDSVWVLFENLVFNRFFGTDVSPAAAFQFTNADLTDKGFFDSSGTKSPMRFELGGTAPNRILKLEFPNMGFAEEYNLYGTLNDYANIQFWLYESDGVVELRYGPSQVSHFQDYLPDSNMQVGIYNQVDLIGQSGMFYFLSGDPASPTIDSIDYTNSDHVPGITGWPAPGTVYRFAPKSLGLQRQQAGMALKAYPSVTRDQLHVDCQSETAAAYRIVSSQGAIAQQGRLVNGSNELNVSALAPGNYVLLAANSSGTGLFRFTRQ